MIKIGFREKVRQTISKTKADLKQAVKIKIEQHKKSSLEEKAFKQILSKKLAVERRKEIERQALTRAREKVKEKFNPSQQKVEDKQRVRKEFMNTFNRL